MAGLRPSLAQRRQARGKRAFAVMGKVRLTHPDRIYWRDAGVTKEELAGYYKKVWTRMKPYVTGRVLALVRCPEGAEGECFFQKHARMGIPTEFLHPLQEEGEKIIAIDNFDGLLALIQGGALEIHVRGSAADDRERANWLVFDLDPGPGVDFKAVIEAAREVRTRMQRLHLTSFIKTTGGKGLHVVIPIKPVPWDIAKEFTRQVALSLEQDNPDRYIARSSKSRRPGRIFVDWLRNSREATAIAPYSTRARPGAPVAVPLSWTELSSLKAANQYTVRNISQRLSRLRTDPWADMSRCRQALPRFK
ncbi:MAG TPA: non-homologous end-joining DNA ligase [Pseudolabrys sp.]|nr:non-homologous end-joining DNA ligase [Pseudolabrys sp.]